jgi:ribosomal protein S18 acetylase RimI-like enzyme
MEVDIRPARASDVPALSELAKRTWSDAFGGSVGRDDEAAELEKTRSEAYFREALRRDAVLVAESDGALVGYVQFGDVHIADADIRTGDQELQRVYVDTELQGLGIGRRLMDAALRHPRLAAAGRVYLQVWERNPRAIGLYESFGFEAVGTTAFMIGGGEPAQDLVMLLDKGPGH